MIKAKIILPQSYPLPIYVIQYAAGENTASYGGRSDQMAQEGLLTHEFSHP